MTLVGAPATPHPSPQVFQPDHEAPQPRRIVADIEMIRAEQINDAYERMLKGDVRYRFVIDNGSRAG